MQTFWKDLRYGLRVSLKKPGFTFIAVLSLALGIGANTAIFSLVNALLLRPLPYSDSDRLVRLSEKTREGRRTTVAYPNFEDWRVRAQSFESMASIRRQAFNLTGVERPVRLQGRTVNWNFFQALGINPQVGRLFSPEDDRYGAARTAILSNGMWRERFGGDPGVLGKPILLDNQAYIVIGVLPPGFEYYQRDDIFTPIGLFLVPNTGLTDRGSSLGLHAVARLKPGVTVEQANSEMAAIGAQLEREYTATNSGKSAMAEGLQAVLSEEVRGSLWVLLGAVGFILLIACVNVANLLLVRAADRQKEVALRLALGASRGRIIQQLLSESLLIAMLGGLTGLLLGAWLLSGLLALAPETIPNLSRVGMDKNVLLFTLAVTGAATVLCGLLPALNASRTDLNTALKEGGRSTAGGSREGVRKGLLIVEVGLALVLLVGAGLLVRSMKNLLDVDPGFNPDHLLTMRMNLSGDAYPAERLGPFFSETLSRVSALPGVRSTALSLSLPIDGSNWNSVFIVSDKTPPPRAELPSSAYNPVSANYFETMGIRLIKGRLFTAADSANAAKVAVINETLARRLWPGEDPLGKRVKQGWPESQTPWREVIGVVRDVKLNGVDRDTPMETYLPITQEPFRGLQLSVRTTGDPLAAAAVVEQTIHTIEKNLPVSTIRSLDQIMGSSLAQRRLTLVLLAGFALLALLLAAIGIYGVISYSVRQRTNEIGVRIALGAQTRDVLGLILGQGMKLAIVGVLIGLAGAWGLTRWMTSLLYNVQSVDPITFVAVPVLLLLSAALACYFPARRAAKIDPLTALRE